MSTERRHRQLEKHIAGLEKARAQWAVVRDAYEREGRAAKAVETAARLAEIDRLLDRARRELENLSR